MQIIFHLYFFVSRDRRTFTKEKMHPLYHQNFGAKTDKIGSAAGIYMKSLKPQACNGKIVEKAFEIEYFLFGKKHFFCNFCLLEASLKNCTFFDLFSALCAYT